MNIFGVYKQVNWLVAIMVLVSFLGWVPSERGQELEDSEVILSLFHSFTLPSSLLITPPIRRMIQRLQQWTGDEN